MKSIFSSDRQDLARQCCHINSILLFHTSHLNLSVVHKIALDRSVTRFQSFFGLGLQV